jgi:hypothetical protein
MQTIHELVGIEPIFCATPLGGSKTKTLSPWSRCARTVSSYRISVEETTRLESALWRGEFHR